MCIRDSPVTVRFTWVEGNRRRDIDNVAFAKKFVLDGLVQAGVIGNDTPQYVTCLLYTSRCV